ncbi:ankyrin repeat-containing domain protein [Trametes punicea]|nr:ankyrin repeat-containing domain protein [Trametes punicea]
MADTKPSVESLPQETLDFAHRMFDAARENNADLLLQAVDVGLPPNLTNEKGNTLLMLAAYSGHATLAKELLARGADPNRTNDQGQSPLAGAVFKGHDEVVRILIEERRSSGYDGGNGGGSSRARSHGPGSSALR